MLACGHGCRGPVAVPGNAALADGAACHNRTLNFDILCTCDLNTAARLKCVGARHRINIDAVTVEVSAASTDKIQAITAKDSDPIFDFEEALVIDPVLGLNQQIGTAAQDVDIAADDDRVSGRQDEFALVRQGGQGAG